MNLQRYRAADLSDLMDRITKNSIGMDTYFDKFFTETITNYPPYNLIQVNNSESRLEIALAGFKKEEVHVYTEYGKLFVEGKKKDKETGSESSSRTSRSQRLPINKSHRIADHLTFVEWSFIM